MQISLTDREADIMRVLWSRGPSVVNEVQSALADQLAYNTVLTVLRVLEGKGYVSHDDEGRAHRYFASIDETAARKSAIRHLTSKLFQGSAELLFAHAVSDKALKPEQLQRIRKLLDEADAQKRGR